MTSSGTLLALGAVGFAVLWGVMLVNGTLDGISSVAENTKFPDARPLRTVYTGYPLVDNNILVVIAFYDLLSNAKASAPQWLFFYLCNILGAIDSWVLIESRRRGVRNLFLRHTIIFIWLWNLGGAAFVAPIYFYFIARSGYTDRDATIPLNEVRGFPPTVVANALFPLFLFYPAWSGWSAYDHQGYIGLYHFTPMLMVVTVVTFSRPGTTLTSFASSKNKDAPNEDAPWVVASYIATGVISAAVHVYVVVAAMLQLPAGSSSLSLSGLFVPAPRNVLAAPRDSYEALLEGAHLFTQLDYLVLSAACVVFTHHMLQKASRGTSRGGNRELAWIILGTVLLGPAAAGSFAFAVREQRLRDEEPLPRGEPEKASRGLFEPSPSPLVYKSKLNSVLKNAVHGH
ncbi:hypothetical protein DL767_002705 [Monosporascus sp. MG133]|nr:hypothetical protein DL767_002705 [Monosporascus sp. MG133]